MKKTMLAVIFSFSSLFSNNLPQEKIEELLNKIENSEHENKKAINDILVSHVYLGLSYVAVAAAYSAYFWYDSNTFSNYAMIPGMLLVTFGAYKEYIGRNHLLNPDHPTPLIDIDTQIQILNYIKSQKMAQENKRPPECIK